MKRMKKLYGRSSPARPVAVRAVCFIAAFVLAYILAVFVPFTVTVRADDYAAAHPYESFFGAGSDERALLMPTDEESFFTRLVLLERAENTVDMATYSIYLDDGARYYFAAMLKAADRGVKVRIFIDAKFEGLSSDEGKKLRTLLRSHENIEYYVYNEIDVFDPAMLAVSMHDKIFNVDDRSLIVGGANIGFRHFVSNSDLEVLVSGEPTSDAVTQVKAYYEQLLTSKHTRRKTEKPDKRLNDYRAALLADYERYYADSAFDKDRDYRAEGVPVNRITLIHNPTEGKKRAPNVLEVLFQLAENSKRVHMRTPYYVLTDEYTERFVRAAGGADEFIIATNSLYNTPNMAFGIYLKKREKLLAPGVQLYEYLNPRQLHGKAAVFDDRLSVIGSFNMDERSAHIDTELMLVIDSEPFNAALRAELDKYLEQSLEVGPDGRYKAGAFDPPAVPTSKKLLYKLYGWLFTPFIQLI